MQDEVGVATESVVATTIAEIDRGFAWIAGGELIDRSFKT
jgi:hypothetical protein